ncbi:MAG: 1-acyl-sn-glycerol-3-phosphate acyltransferase [Gemmataceae bacterium]|nr:1-acyl-sn-glycerol-3-phosphate acyltransferase [Gemmataceae bacterium]
MQNIVIAEPYQFVPPLATTVWTWPIRYWLPRRVRSAYGVRSLEFRGMEKITAALDAGHGVLLAPNHCRPCDPEIIGVLCCQIARPCYMMASWHLFKQGAIQRFMLRAGGVFSVNREGADRESIKAATAMLVDGRRPLILFPEGIISRSNDRLRPVMDGTAFIARAAAKIRAKSSTPGKVVIFPIALHYYFDGDLRAAVEPVLAKIEKRLSWQSQQDLPLVERVKKLGEGLLGIKELEYFGFAQAGPIADRLPRLIDQVLTPLEKRYELSQPGNDVMERIKKIRSLIVAELIAGQLPKAEVDRRWRFLVDCYFAQCLACYPVGYLDDNPSVERILETVERYEEDLTDKTTIHQPLRCVGEVCDAIEVSPERPRGAADPAMVALEESLKSKLAELARHGTAWKE